MANAPLLRDWSLTERQTIFLGKILASFEQRSRGAVPPPFRCAKRRFLHLIIYNKSLYISSCSPNRANMMPPSRDVGRCCSAALLASPPPSARAEGGVTPAQLSQGVDRRSYRRSRAIGFRVPTLHQNLPAGMSATAGRAPAGASVSRRR